MIADTYQKQGNGNNWKDTANSHFKGPRALWGPEAPASRPYPENKRASGLGREEEGSVPIPFLKGTRYSWGMYDKIVRTVFASPTDITGV